MNLNKTAERSGTVSAESEDTMRTMCKNLRELNAKLKAAGAGYKIIFMCYMPTGKVGSNGEKTRHYMSEITEGKNAGCTCGDYFEIDFGMDDEDFDELEEEI